MQLMTQKWPGIKSLGRQAFFRTPPWGTEGDTAWSGAVSSGVTGISDETKLNGSVSHSAGNMALRAVRPYTGTYAAGFYYLAKSVVGFTRPYTIETKILTIAAGGAPSGQRFKAGFRSAGGYSSGSMSNATGSDNWGVYFGNNYGTGYVNGLPSPYAGPRYWRFRLNTGTTYTTFSSTDGISWTEVGTLTWSPISSGITHFFVECEVGGADPPNGTMTATIDYIRLL